VQHTATQWYTLQHSATHVLGKEDTNIVVLHTLHPDTCTDSNVYTHIWIYVYVYQHEYIHARRKTHTETHTETHTHKQTRTKQHTHPEPVLTSAIKKKKTTIHTSTIQTNRESANIYSLCHFKWHFRKLFPKFETKVCSKPKFGRLSCNHQVKRKLRALSFELCRDLSRCQFMWDRLYTVLPLL